MKLSIIMPVYNEAPTVKQAILRVLRQKYIFELLVVNDGSNDGSSKILRRIKNPKLSIYNHSKNKGKGAAIKTALKHIKGDYVLINDADLEYDPKDIKQLTQPVLEKKAKVAYGSRFRGAHTNMFFWHQVGNNFLNFLINILFDTTLSDMETCYKLIPTKMIKSFDFYSDGFGFEPELTCKILKRGERIFEVPISYAGRTYAEGKKLKWTEGLRALAIIFKEKLTS